jgi:hypothetical protein
MNTARFPILFAALLLFAGCSCSAPKPTPDPLTGFHFSSLDNLHSTKAIMDDYQNYIQKLPPNESGPYFGPVFYFEDGTGQHAIRIETNENNERWYHVLIYNKENKRIKLIKYCEGRIQS